MPRGRAARAVWPLYISEGKMRIEYLVHFAGPGVKILPGDVREVDDAEAQRLIDRGYARCVPSGSRPRSVPSERAISRTAARREKTVQD